MRTHTRDAVPFAIAGKRIESVIELTFDEESATQGDLHIPHGHEMMEYLLTVR